MESDQLPSGFVSALMRNENAVNAYAMMTKEQKKAVLEKARSAHSRQEMEQLLAQVAQDGAF